MEGINLYWLDNEKVYKRDYKYAGPEDTYKIIDIEGEENFNSDNGRIKLKDQPYLIGLDMSTTQSGIVIMDDNWDIVTMIDLINQGEKGDSYLNHLRAVFNSNFKRMECALVVLEEQIKTENGRMVYGKMSELQGSVLSMSGIFGKKINRVKPSVWRSAFLADSKYTGRKQKTIDVKISTGEEVETRFPKVKKYIDVMTQFSKSDQGYICDSCDAVGALLGYLELNYGKDKSMTMQRVNKTLNYEAKHDITQFGFSFNPQTGKIVGHIGSSQLVERDINNVFVNEINGFGKKYIAYNVKLPLEENVRRCTSSFHEIIFILVPDRKGCVQLEWEYNITIPEGEMGLIVCYSTNHIVKKEKSIPVF